MDAERIDAPMAAAAPHRKAETHHPELGEEGELHPKRTGKQEGFRRKGKAVMAGLKVKKRQRRIAQCDPALALKRSEKRQIESLS